MKIFKSDKDKPKTFSQEVNRQNIIKSPTKLNIVNNDLSRYLLTTFISIADEEDYDKFMAYVANDFYSKNYFFLNSLKNIGNNDMDSIWENLNLFLYNNNLGFSEVEINTEKKTINIIQYESIFVKYLKEVVNFKVCNFYSHFYSKLLSNLFETDIYIMEEKCANTENKDYCLFTNY